MLGRFARAAIAVAFGALIATVFASITAPIVDVVAAGIGADANVTTWIVAVVTWFPAIAFVSVLMDVLAGAISEGSVGRV
jgi:hypothetical protein